MAAGPSREARAVWLDAARALAILPVFWLHAGGAPAWISPLVGGSLLFFFFCAGYFLPRNTVEIGRRGARLLAAWAVWSLLAAGLALSFSQPWNWHRFAGLGVSAYNAPLWFLRNLAIFTLIAAGLRAVGILSRFALLTVCVLFLLPYSAEAPQHVCLRFDYLPVFAAGIAVRCHCSLEQITASLEHQACPCVVLIATGFTAAEIGGAAGVASCFAALSLPVVGILLQRYVPAAAQRLSSCGRCMLFCYAVHSFFLAPLYLSESGIVIAGNAWVPPLLLALLPPLHALLQRRFPRLTALLCAQPLRRG